MMSIADIFVGSVALILGTAALIAAMFNLEAVFQLPKAQAIENRFGRKGARICLAVLGLLLVGLGCLVLVGFAPNAEGRTGQERILKMATLPSLLPIPLQRPSRADKLRHFFSAQLGTWGPREC